IRTQPSCCRLCVKSMAGAFRSGLRGDKATSAKSLSTARATFFRREPPHGRDSGRCYSVLNDFPGRKQPHPFGCLPTCVQAVLSYYGEELSYDEVSEMCRELPHGGCFWSDTIPG